MSNGIVRRDTLVPVPAPAAGRGARLAEARWASEGVREFLVFAMGTERMALPLASVQEILKVTAVTHVPRAPAAVLGILSVRGRITTVIDLRRRLGMPEREPTRHARVLLVDSGDEVIGVRVDAVLHVVRLRQDEIEHAGIVASDMPDHVLGLGRPHRKDRDDAVRAVAEAEEADVVVLLDPAALLSR